MPKLHVQGIDLHYITAGQGQPVLLLHGLGSSARDWEFQFPAFSERYQVVAVDTRGHGESSKPPGPYSLPLFASDVAGLIKALEIAPAHVLGISMGGMIAFQMAVSAPELVSSLVIVNAAPELIVRTFRERLNLIQRQLIVRLLGMRRMGEVLGGRLLPKPDQEELRRVFADRWAENDPKAYRETMKALVGWSVADQLGDIRCPVLVIAAENDYTPVALKEAYIKRMPSAKLVVIEDSTHATPVDQPEKFNRAVLDFWAAQSGVLRG